MIIHDVYWKKANVTTTFKKGEKDDPGKNRPVSLLGAIYKDVKHRKVTGSSHHGFTKKKPCLTNLTAFYSDTSALVNKGRTVGVYLNFSKVFKSVCHNILVDERIKFRPDKCTAKPTENCLKCWTQNGTRPSWRPVISSVPQVSILFPIWFNLDDGTACTFNKTEENAELGGAIDVLDDCAAFQRNHSNMEKWANKNFKKFK